MGLFNKTSKPVLKVVKRGDKYSVYNFSGRHWYTARTWNNKRIVKEWLRK